MQDPSAHPALTGCADVEWSAIPGCPDGVPVVLRGLADADAAEEADSVLDRLVMSGPMSISAAMPSVVPFLLRLTVDPSVPRRTELLGMLLIAAALSEPVAPGSGWAVAHGPDEDHPERTLCRAAFAADPVLVRQLLADQELLARASLDDGDRDSLAAAAGL
ncbi:hypothetical protein ACIQU5_30695 [Streptomyces sp. NPDC090306]|uniref:hypothetical protein n=1 Tax=Streptomyces sp. NPDC090306 TaxID=3365961 RepID=UPI0038152E82